MGIQDRDWYRAESIRMTRIEAMVRCERQAVLQRRQRRAASSQRTAGAMIHWHLKLDAPNRRGRNLVFNGLITSWALALVVALVWLFPWDWLAFD